MDVSTVPGKIIAWSIIAATVFLLQYGLLIAAAPIAGFFAIMAVIGLVQHVQYTRSPRLERERRLAYCRSYSKGSKWFALGGMLYIMALLALWLMQGASPIFWALAAPGIAFIAYNFVRSDFVRNALRFDERWLIDRLPPLAAFLLTIGLVALHLAHPVAWGWYLLEAAVLFTAIWLTAAFVDGGSRENLVLFRFSWKWAFCFTATFALLGSVFLYSSGLILYGSLAAALALASFFIPLRFLPEEQRRSYRA